MRQLQLSVDATILVTEEELDDILQGKTVHRLNVPDLPIEVWLEVLSYLPRGFVWKMIGVNRALFELGMDELYEEVRLMDYNGAGLKTFEQMAHPKTASRVRHLYLRPTFLPGMNSRGKAIYDKGESATEIKRRKLTIRKFLVLALESLTRCLYLQEMTITIHDQYLTRSLVTFLGKLLKRVGTRLRALTIDMTLSSFLSIYHIFNPKLLSELSSLTIRITTSRFETSPRQARRIRKALLHLITSRQTTLQSLAFEVIDFNLSKIFQKLQNLPLLRSLELRAEIGFSTLIPTIHFVTFLQHNINNLECLVIRRPTVDSISTWSLQETIRRLYDLLCIQKLPNLKELILEVDYAVIFTSLVAHIHTFVPHLRKLTLTGQSAVLDDSQLTSLLSGLALCDKGLEYLRISLIQFSPDNVDLLVTSLPNLKSLDLVYRMLWAPEKPSDSDKDIAIYDLFSARRYPQWSLKELRLLQVNVCSEGHPDIQLLNAMAKSVPTITRAVRTRTCECRW